MKGKPDMERGKTMPVQRKPAKLTLILAAALCLTAVAAYAGYAVARSTTPAKTVSDAASVSGWSSAASGRTMTIYACLEAGKLTSVSTKPPKCPAKSVAIQWTAQADPSTSPTPKPAASATPRPSPTSTAIAKGAACVTSANKGTCGPYTGTAIVGGDQTNVIQDVWNPISAAAQTLTAYGPGDWSVNAKMPDGNTAVVSYPDTQELYTTTRDTPDPLSNFGTITSSYAESAPPSGNDDYEAAYDIWAGTGSDNYAQEIMIWVNNHGQRPAGSDVASATIDGVGYQIWSQGKAGTVSNPVSMVRDSNESSGSVNVLGDLKWLESNGYMPSGSGLNQIDFGFEICSTGGVPQTFTMNQYELTAN
jgi:hypothetical protein